MTTSLQRMTLALLRSRDLFGDAVAAWSMTEIIAALEASGTDLPQHVAPPRAELIEVLRKNLLSQAEALV